MKFAGFFVTIFSCDCEDNRNDDVRQKKLLRSGMVNSRHLQTVFLEEEKRIMGINSTRNKLLRYFRANFYKTHEKAHVKNIDVTK